MPMLLPRGFAMYVIFRKETKKRSTMISLHIIVFIQTFTFSEGNNAENSFQLSWKYLTDLSLKYAAISLWVSNRPSCSCVSASARVQYNYHGFSWYFLLIFFLDPISPKMNSLSQQATKLFSELPFSFSRRDRFIVVMTYK